MRLFVLLFLCCLGAASFAAVPQTPAGVLDALHARAAAADFEGYFELYADDAVFLGTDASERWPIDRFRDYTRARFATGTGWTYVPMERHLMTSADGRTIWFDELLEGERMGPCRGTGVLVLTDDGWRVAHYSLTLLVPNEIAGDVVDQVRALQATPP
ncbi:MAG: nuclear transport factor 2 family protein [Pseudomonadales bacterium]|jgi:ketosteroid isomerase-like protein|nr:nuclear transport factor 2 family protein [Pseudomonadales bacterium]